MGLFDSVMVRCPNCGVEGEFQSKGADCPYLKVYHLEKNEVPNDVLLDINRHGPITCECGTKYQVELDVKITHKTVVVADEDGDN